MILLDQKEFIFKKTLCAFEKAAHGKTLHLLKFAVPKTTLKLNLDENERGIDMNQSDESQEPGK